MKKEIKIKHKLNPDDNSKQIEFKQGRMKES